MIAAISSLGSWPHPPPLAKAIARSARRACTSRSAARYRASTSTATHSSAARTAISAISSNVGQHIFDELLFRMPMRSLDARACPSVALVLQALHPVLPNSTNRYSPILGLRIEVGGTGNRDLRSGVPRFAFESTYDVGFNTQRRVRHGATLRLLTGSNPARSELDASSQGAVFPVGRPVSGPSGERQPLLHRHRTLISSATLRDIGIDDEFEQSGCGGKQPNRSAPIDGATVVGFRRYQARAAGPKHGTVLE